MEQISTLRDQIDSLPLQEDIEFRLANEIDVKYLQPFHIATLACLLAYSINSFRRVSLNANDKVEDFLRNVLHLEQYFADSPHIDASEPSIFNLWKVDATQTFGYSHSLSMYLRSSFFKGKDISAFTNALNELYANVADHSKANGVAYSYIVLDESKETIQIAFCDFGIGIPDCLKNAAIEPKDGCGYVQWATRPGVSAKSSSHNAGKGLDDVISSIPGDYDRVKILSGNEFCIVGEKKLKDNSFDRIEKTIYLPFCFKGTLIYFQYDISDLENEEIIGESDLLTDYNW